MNIQRKPSSFSKSTVEKLKYYVYLYSDPDTKKVFYIGKGQGNRCFDHLGVSDEEDSQKAKKLRELWNNGKEPKIEILAWGLDEKTAFAVESAAIDLVDIQRLTNQQRGHHSATQGRILAQLLDKRLSAKEITPEQIFALRQLGVLLVRLSLYRPNMSDGELYDLTRSAWKLSEKRLDDIRYVFSVVDGKIIETYKVTKWLPDNSTWNSLKLNAKEGAEGCWEFVGRIAPELHQQYADLDVSALFTKGQQNPLRYLLPNLQETDNT